MRSLRSYLIAFVLVVVLPSLSFGVVASWELSVWLHRDAEEDARLLVHGAAETMAAHLREQIMALTVLARVPLLVSTPEAFYQVAEDYQRRSGYHVMLADTEGHKLFSTRKPFGTPLPPRTAMDSVKTAIRTANPNVSDVFFSRLAAAPVVSIDIPLSTPEGGRIVSLSADLAQIAKPMRQVEVPEGWLVALIDGQGQVIHRSVDPDTWVGRRVQPEVLTAVQQAAAVGTGHLDHPNPGGLMVHTIFERVPGTGWTALIDLPQEILSQPLRQPLIFLTAAMLVTLALTALLAVLMGRPLHRAARRLTAAAEALGRGEVPQPTALLLEFEQVSRELINASEVIHSKQAKLAEARLAAEQANEAKTRFLGSVSHDLRQPLMAQRLLQQVAASHATTPAQIKVCEQMEAALAATETMLTRLMDFAALETGNVAVRREVFRLDRLIQTIVEENDDIAADKGLAIGLRALPCWTESDPVLLGRVVRNLVANAVRYTVRGGLLVGIRRRGPLLRVEVWDTGKGIPADRQQAIFEEFRQLDNPERNRTKGQGLGLAIVAKTVDLLGHRLTMRSVAGRGSVFAVEVPAAGPAAKAEVAADILAAVPASDILLVEDDEVQASALADILHDLGHRVAVAHDAAAALAVQPQALDLIITDYRLPGEVTGVDLVTRLRGNARRRVPAVIITGDTQQTIAAEAAMIECEILHKPCSPQALLRAIARALAPA
ncbi:MAG: ATP-binding protein [Rhodospirillaceae bacterium]